MCVTAVIVSRTEMSTCCPSPLTRLRWRAIRLLAAAHVEAMTCAWEPARVTGGSSASPVTYIEPPSALAMRSEDLKSLYGPVCPKPVIEVSTRPGFASASAR
jgi:hypothetical protein